MVKGRPPGFGWKKGASNPGQGTHLLVKVGYNYAADGKVGFVFVVSPRRWGNPPC